MKRKIVDIEEVFSTENMRRAEKEAGSGIKAYRSTVIAFRKNLDKNLENLRLSILNGTYEPDKGHNFKVWSHGKWRWLTNVNYPTRIVDQCIVNALEPIVYRSLIERTYGCIKGRGSLAASLQLRKDLPRCPIVAQLDIRKYYPSIRRDTLVKCLSRRIKGTRFLQLVERVLYAYVNPNEGLQKIDGVSIGSILSQLIGIFNLMYLDHFVHEVLGVRYYVRYVDDMIMGFDNKEDAHKAISGLQAYLHDNLGLEIKKPKIINTRKQPVDFCGYLHFVDRNNKVYVRLRRHIVCRFRRNLNATRKKMFVHPESQTWLSIRSSVYSHLGFLKYCNSYKLLTIIKRENYEVFSAIRRYATDKRTGRTGRDAAS